MKAEYRHMILVKTVASVPCPVCGCRRMDLWEQRTPVTLTPFHCECARCRHPAPARGSKRYAIAAWEKGGSGT